MKTPTYKLADYDFLGSIYKNTKASELTETFESIKIQTHKPKKIILVLDGFINKKVMELVNKYTNILPIKKIPIKKCWTRNCSEKRFVRMRIKNCIKIRYR